MIYRNNLPNIIGKLYMIISYLTQITLVYYHYTNNGSVSNIICNDNCKNKIIFFMVLMGLGTILYEYERNDNISIFLIFILLVGLYGLIYINENNMIHYIFAFIVFISILSFMILHCYKKYCFILLVSLLLEIICGIYLIITIKRNIFYSEVFYILNFAFFYLYLHYISFYN